MEPGMTLRRLFRFVRCEMGFGIGANWPKNAFCPNPMRSVVISMWAATEICPDTDVGCGRPWPPLGNFHGRQQAVPDDRPQSTWKFRMVRSDESDSNSESDYRYLSAIRSSPVEGRRVALTRPKPGKTHPFFDTNLGERPLYRAPESV